MWKGVGLTVVLVAAVGVPDLRAQTAPSADSKPGWEIEAYVGGARHSPVGRHLGLTPDRNHLFIGLHLSRSIVDWGWGRFAYAPDIVPLLIVTNNPYFRERPILTPVGSVGATVETGSGPVAGCAASPIGFETTVRLASHLKVYGGGAAGIVWFTRDVPVTDSRAFNYTFEFGGGLQWQFSGRRFLRVGYKFHHLSNAYTARANPGVDGNVFMIGMGLALGHVR